MDVSNTAMNKALFKEVIHIQKADYNELTEGSQSEKEVGSVVGESVSEGVGVDPRLTLQHLFLFFLRLRLGVFVVFVCPAGCLFVVWLVNGEGEVGVLVPLRSDRQHVLNRFNTPERSEDV